MEGLPVSRRKQAIPVSNEGKRGTYERFRGHDGRG